ncbi:MAG: MYXO-CTERM sorting domain-containing protein [Bradymonadaceae bacterium]|nr:MYXO-CTERM sorting domain-containing protein [Lujinxingiaceae bacterium]
MSRMARRSTRSKTARLPRLAGSATAVSESCACTVAQPSKSPAGLAIFGLLGFAWWRRRRSAQRSKSSGPKSSTSPA